MRIIGRSKIEDFIKTHSYLNTALEEWLLNISDPYCIWTKVQDIPLGLYDLYQEENNHLVFKLKGRNPCSIECIVLFKQSLVSIIGLSEN